MSRSPDVSVCLFARSERTRLYASVTSVIRSIERAEQEGLAIDLLGVLCNSSGPTESRLCEIMGPRWRNLRLDGSSLGMARRSAALASKGHYVTYLDAGDVWSENWIVAAIAAASSRPGPAVWRHEAVLQSGDDYYHDPENYTCTFQPDECQGFDYAAMLGENPFATSFLTQQEILAAVPFPCEDTERGWDSPDWWWNCNVVSEGYHHRIVPETFLYRRYSPSDPLALRRIGPTRLSRNTAGRHTERRSVVWD